MGASAVTGLDIIVTRGERIGELHILGYVCGVGITSVTSGRLLPSKPQSPLAAEAPVHAAVGAHHAGDGLAELMVQ